MYLNILFLPFITILIISIFGRYMSHTGIYRIILFMLIEILLISILLYIETINNILTIDLNIHFGKLYINWYIIYDNLTAIMIIMILSISLLVIIYTYDYMINDAHINRFLLYIVLFIFNILILITTSNLVILFIGWEGVGLVSYLLITYWFTRLETNLGGLIAIYINRIGDVIYLLGIILGYIWYRSLDINLYLTSNEWLIILFFLAAMSKSAQLYLHIWLPFSMEGPTPISALIHAATMVTAGVYLMLRLSLVISYTYYALFFISIIGALTCLIGGILALISLDIKELVAYSTMSQLGYMMTSIGIKYYNLSFYHLIFHAYFKALLFLTVGSIIHTILDIQDIRYTGSLFSFLPLSYIFLLYGFTSLTGLPFTTGFYSKENIIFMAYNNNLSNNLFLNQYVFIITFLTAFITVLYSYKFIYNIFFNTTKLSIFLFKHLHFYSLHLIFSLSILSLLTLFIGFILNKTNILLNIDISYLDHNIDLWYIKLLPLTFFIISFIILNLSINNNLITKLEFGFKYIFIYIYGIILSISYRILFKLLENKLYNILWSGTDLFKLSKKLSSYIENKYIISIFTINIFILLLII